MKKITYGAPNLVDWVAQIKAGAATVRVHFTGGALTSYGVTPAEYSESDRAEFLLQGGTHYNGSQLRDGKPREE